MPGLPATALRASCSSRATWRAPSSRRRCRHSISRRGGREPASRSTRRLTRNSRRPWPRSAPTDSNERRGKQVKSQEFLETTTKGPVKAIMCGTLIDGRGGKPVKNAVVLIQGNRIVKVGEKGKLKTPPNAELIDCSKYTVMPGMMDLHIHTAMHNCMTFHNHRVAQFETMPHLQQMYA